MKRPLLDIVNEILNDIDGLPVNDLSESQEARQIASIVRSTYYDLAYLRDWAEFDKLGKLTSVSDPQYPTYLKLPNDTIELKSVRYNKEDVDGGKVKMADVHYEPPELFLKRSLALSEDDASVDLLSTLEGNPLKVRNDRHPTYYTSFDDVHLTFDAYNSQIDNTLIGDKSQIFFVAAADFQIENDFIPKLPVSAFVELTEASKAAASLKLRQTSDPIAEYRTKRHSARAAQKNRKINQGIRYRDMGRKGVKGWRQGPLNPTFRSSHE